MVWFGIGNGLGRDSVLGEKFGLARQRLDSCCRRFQQPPMSLRERTRPGLGIFEPCLPSPAKAPPSGPGWLHEIKHDGFRIMAWRDSAGVQLITRHGNDFTSRFPVIVAAVTALPALRRTRRKLVCELPLPAALVRRGIGHLHCR